MHFPSSSCWASPTCWAFGNIATLEAAVKTKSKYPYLVDEGGAWTRRKDVRNVFVMCSGNSPARDQHNDWMSVDFGKSSADQHALPGDLRKLQAVQKVDPEFEALLYQFGCYLLISCSRPGGLPTNLQGLWNDRNNPPRHGDYHTNINVQMIGKWGHLQEWMEDIDDPNDGHRHTSHPFAVYPGQQIGMKRTPGLAAAARKSLLARIQTPKPQQIEWAFAWRTALFARLHDGDSAHAMFRQFFRSGISCKNLFGLIGGAMQIDGNLGITGCVSEMLMQSHEGEIVLLPALPKAWPAGSVKGLRARGGFEVDIAWQDGKITNYRIRSKEPREVAVRVNGQVKKVKAELMK